VDEKLRRLKFASQFTGPPNTGPALSRRPAPEEYMPTHHAASRRVILFALPAALAIGITSTAWGQAGATGSSSGESGPANQSTGPTVPAPGGNDNAGSTSNPSAPGTSGNGASGTPGEPGLDQMPSSGATTRGNTGEKPSCENGAINAARCNGSAPPR
jgi:hypothetical protein